MNDVYQSPILMTDEDLESWMVFDTYQSPILMTDQHLESWMVNGNLVQVCWEICDQGSE